MRNVSVVIVAAGRGERLGSPKQFLPLGGIPLLLWSVRTFARHERVSEVVTVLPAGLAEAPPDWLVRESVRCCAGGETRRESAGAGVRSASPDASIILIHDAARPFVTPELIDRVLEGASRTGAALPVLPVTDTIKRARGDRVVETVERSDLGRAQTPQGFEAALIRGLHERAARDIRSASDDSALCEWEGLPVEAVAGESTNLKITTASDLAYAEWLVDSGRLPVPGEQDLSGGSL